MPHCYRFYSQCSDCRKVNPIRLAARTLPPSPVHAQRKRCTKCHRDWSLIRFPSNGIRENEVCCFCCIPKFLFLV